MWRWDEDTKTNGTRVRDIVNTGSQDRFPFLYHPGSVFWLRSSVSPGARARVTVSRVTEEEAEIIAEIEQEGEEEELLQLMEFESTAVVLLDALGVLGGAGRGAEACEETESAEQLVRIMEPRRLSWYRRRFAAMWLARKAGWFFPPRLDAHGSS